MALMASVTKTLILLMALATCAYSFTPPQDNATPKQAHQRIAHKSNQALQAAAATRAEPVYPDVARWAGIIGVVSVEVLINEQGEVLDAYAVTGHPLLKNAAVFAARQWKFKPVESGGVAVKVSGWLSIKVLADVNQSSAAADDDIDKAKEATKIFPNAAEAYYWLGTKYESSDQNQEAEKAFKKALELKPDYEEVYLDLIDLYTESKDNAGVLKTYQQAISNIPNSLKLLTDYTEKLYAEYRAPDTANIAKRAIEINPDDLNIRHMLAWAYLKLGRADDALAETLQEVKLAPQDSLAHHYLGEAYALQQRYEEALAQYRYALTMKPSDSDLNVLYLDMGQALLQLKRPQEALEALNHAAEIKEDTPDLACGLTTAYIMLSRFEDAINVAKKGIKTHPDVCLSTYLGIAYVNIGKQADAEPAFRMSVELQPDSPEIHLNLIRVLMDQDKTEEAERLVQQMIN